MRLRWTRSGLADLQRIWLFLADRDPERADRITGRIRQRVLILQEFPRLGIQLGSDDLHEFSLTDVQYVVRYRLARGEVRIMRLWSTRENREGQ